MMSKHFTLKAGALTLLILLSLFFSRVEYSHAQTENAIYLKMDYLKVNENATPRQYLEVELGEWRSIHKERIRQGATIAWYLYKVFPGTTAPDGDLDYDFVTISVYENRELVDSDLNTEAIFIAHPGIKIEDLYHRADQVRTFAGTDLWRLESVTSPYTSGKPYSEFLTINYFNTDGGSGEHMELETEVWENIHEERIRRNVLNSGALLVLKNPGQSERVYDYGTIDYYDSLHHLREPLNHELFRAALPHFSEEEIEGLLERTGRARASHKSQLWRLTDYIHRDSLED